MKVVVNFHLGTDVRMSVPEAMLTALRQRFPTVGFAAADDPDTLAREAADADVFFGFVFPPELLPKAPRLRWVQSISAGVESQLAALSRVRDLVVTNGSGVAADVIAEHVIGLMLALCRNLHVAVRLQQAARWDRAAVIARPATPVREFQGSRIAVLGLGPIGIAVAGRAAALGTTVRGLRRRPPGAPLAPFEVVVGPEGLDGLLEWGDFVVLALPHTPETEGLIGRRELALMGRDAYLVNVARGSIVNEQDLVDALRRRAIAGAALDVFADEPLPPSSPLWQLDNVIVTPHVAGATPHYFTRALELFMGNLQRHLEGAPLSNVVDARLGYPLKP